MRTNALAGEQVLSPAQLTQFIDEGYIKLEKVFTEETADEALNILWKDTGCDPHDPSTWTQPVVRLGEYPGGPFGKAANMPILHAAFNQLVGPGKWVPKKSLGSFPVRFPVATESNDTGWHVDASFPGKDPGDFFGWRINIHSKGRALLMLFLFSDVDEKDAPTRIRGGSHLDVARILKDAGEEGMSFMELAAHLNNSTSRDEILATGSKGTVFLCHPFLVHAAQAHHGTRPKFMAQPALMTATDFNIYNCNGSCSPVEQAIRKAIGLND